MSKVFPMATPWWLATTTITACDAKGWEEITIRWSYSSHTFIVEMKAWVGFYAVEVTGKAPGLRMSKTLGWAELLEAFDNAVKEVLDARIRGNRLTSDEQAKLRKAATDLRKQISASMDVYYAPAEASR